MAQFGNSVAQTVLIKCQSMVWNGNRSYEMLKLSPYNEYLTSKCISKNGHTLSYIPRKPPAKCWKGN